MLHALCPSKHVAFLESKMEKIMSILKKTFVAAALSLAFGGAQAALIDLDGLGGVHGAINASVLDWTIGNSLVTPVRGNVTDPDFGDIYQTYAHARLATANNGSGDPVDGLFGNSEWTYVTGFRETVFDVTGSAGTGSATFNTIAGGNNFFEIWYSNTAGTLSNNLTGRNFNDGVRILWGTVTPFDFNDPNKLGQTTFTATTPVDTQGNLLTPDLDQNGIDNYPAIDTITGQGGGRIGLQVVGWNSDFFLNMATGTIEMDFDTQLNLPFTKTDPSSCFWDGTQYVDGAGPVAPANLAQCQVNTLGPINGLTGPNEALMTDASTRLDVPEPLSLALFGIGLAAMGATSRRRKA